MRRFVTVAIVVFGCSALLLGLLFVIGSAAKMQRLVIGGVLVASGAGMVGIGVRRFKGDAANSPQRLRADILELAKREDGEISREEVIAMAGLRAQAAATVLETLVAEGVCRRTERKGSQVFVFPHLQPRLTVLRCDYCATEQDLNSGLDTCPRCGGPLQKSIVARSLAEGQVFNMDEETPP